MTIQSYIELSATLIAAFALCVSYFSLKESKYAREEFGRAFLSMELIQTSGGLYALLRNIGNTYAYDVSVTVSDEFVNAFESLTVLQPDTSYRSLLINNQIISAYPEKIVFEIKYHDYYSQKDFIEKTFTFSLIDYLKYEINFNKEFNCYDIKKSF